MKILRKVLNILVDILIVFVLVVSLLFATMSLTSKSSGISTVFGYTVQVVQSDSMKGGSDEYPGGNFEKDDLIIGKTTSFDSTAAYSVGDIVTYKGKLKGYEDLGDQLICHRIVDVELTEDGNMVYQTQGDNRSVSEIPDQNDVSDYIHSYDIAAVFHTSNYDGKVLKGVGAAFNFLGSQLGFFLCVLLPMIFFFLYVLIKVVINFVNYKNELEKEKQLSAGNAAALNASGVAAQNMNFVPPVNSFQGPEQSMQQNPQFNKEQLEQFEQFQQFQQFLAYQNMQNAYKASQNVSVGEVPSQQHFSNDDIPPESASPDTADDIKSDFSAALAEDNDA